MNKRAITILLATSLLAGTGGAISTARAAPDAIQIVADDIGGVVTSAKGPEAGVWVIAETKELPTRYIKIVVTDDQGRYVLPHPAQGEVSGLGPRLWPRR